MKVRCVMLILENIKTEIKLILCNICCIRIFLKAFPLLIQQGKQSSQLTLIP